MGPGDAVHAGAFVVEGEGRAVVTAIGAGTRLAAIARLTSAEPAPSGTLARELDRVVRVIAVTAVLCGAGFFADRCCSWALPASDGFLFAIGVTVALVPEGLLPTVTLSLAIGAQRMAERHALVRRLEAVETLGLDDVHLYRQDRHADAEPDERRARSGRRPVPSRIAGTGYAPSDGGDGRSGGGATRPGHWHAVARPLLERARRARSTAAGSRGATRWRRRSTSWPGASRDPVP